MLTTGIWKNMDNNKQDAYGAAHRAGMKCIAVTTTNPRQDLVEADVIVDSLTELEKDYFQS